LIYNPIVEQSFTTGYNSNMDDTIDLLQIKIEKAKAQLSNDTIGAINAVDWKAVILGLRAKKGYNLEQLEDLELETELLLCGLVSPEDYPRELQNRMKISRTQASNLVNEMNEQVFAKIKAELIKITERKAKFATTEEESIKSVFETSVLDNTKEEEKKNTQILNSAGIEILKENNKETLPITEKLELPKGEEPAHPQEQSRVDGIRPILTQKLSSPVKIPSVKTDYSLDNLTKNGEVPVKPTPPGAYPKNADPYRLPPE